MVADFLVKEGSHGVNTDFVGSEFGQIRLRSLIRMDRLRIPCIREK